MRTETALPITPQSEMTPAYHPPGARCLDCRHWASDGHPNLRECRFFGETDANWSCLLFRRLAV